jgi:hypothetical protein
MKRALVLLPIFFALLIIGSYASKSCYVIDCNPTGSREIDAGINCGSLEVRSGRRVGPISIKLFKISRGDPLLNGLRVDPVGGILGLNYFRNYTAGTQIGNGPMLIDKTACLNVVTINPWAGVTLCLGFFLLLRQSKGLGKSKIPPAFDVFGGTLRSAISNGEVRI